MIGFCVYERVNFMPKGIYNRSKSKYNNGFSGHNHTKKTKNKISKNRKMKNINESHPDWKGDKAGYRALHIWIVRRLGKAKKCEKCGKEITSPKSIQWANKDHKYRRNLTDWISLCVKCHKKFDKKL